MGVVVYNPTNSPVRTDAGQVDGKGWKHIEDTDSVQSHIKAGRLVIAHAPEDMSLVRPEAREAFEALSKSQTEEYNATAAESDPEPEQVQEEKFQPKPSARKRKAGDTEVSEASTTKPTTEKEA